MRYGAISDTSALSVLEPLSFSTYYSMDYQPVNRGRHFAPIYLHCLQINIGIKNIKRKIDTLIREGCSRSTGLERRLEIRGELAILRREIKKLRSTIG